MVHYINTGIILLYNTGINRSRSSAIALDLGVSLLTTHNSKHNTRDNLILSMPALYWY